MLLSVAIASLLVPLVANAQTYPGFTPEVTANLIVEVNGKPMANGQNFPRSDLAEAPGIGFNSSTTPLNTSATYLLMMIDTDVLRPDPQKGPQVQILLHWLDTNVSAIQISSPSTIAPSENFVALSSPVNETAVAEYRQPNPPANQTHRYVFLLYTQPENFVVPEYLVTALGNGSTVAGRLPFDFSGFVELAGLSDPVAANYWQVTNINATNPFIPGVNGTATGLTGANGTSTEGGPTTTTSASASASAVSTSTSGVGSMKVLGSSWAFCLGTAMLFAALI